MKRGTLAPADLNGRRIGLQAWYTSAALWGRAILIDDYGLDFKSVTWVAQRGDTVGDWQPLCAGLVLPMPLLPSHS